MNAPLDELIAAIGTHPALRLVSERGGTRVYVPTEARLTEDCPLTRIIGVVAAAKLSRMWGGEWIAIPLAKAYARRRRDREIRARLKSETASALAREFETSERNIYIIAAAGAQDDELDDQGKPAAQLGLFG
ncbi:MAG: hypothetical protein JJE27_03535 [Thermoleophilia bacterium]|nr:hypothetical protein [Thermoleophilia bacterium]